MFTGWQAIYQFLFVCLFVCLCDVFMLIVMMQHFGIDPEEDSEDKIDEDVEAEGHCTPHPCTSVLSLLYST